jgi:hypothetical protein
MNYLFFGDIYCKVGIAHPCILRVVIDRPTLGITYRFVAKVVANSFLNQLEQSPG